MSRPSHTRAVLIAVLVTVLWSTSWVLIRWGLDGEDLEPLTFAALRYGLAALVLLGWVVARRDVRGSVRHLDREAFGRIVVLGLVFYAITQGAQFVAIDRQPAATSSLVLSWTPLLVAALAGRSLAERAARSQVAGGVLVVAGAWLYFAGDLGATTVGMAAALVALGANTAGALLGRGVNREVRVRPVVVTALSMAVGSSVLVAVGAGIEGLPTLTARAWLIVAWLAVVNTALAFTLWNLSLQRLTATESAIVNNTMLIQIALLGWLFLDEPLGPSELLGIAVVTAGILVAQLRHDRPGAAAPR